jgi:hypothetical protein
MEELDKRYKRKLERNSSTTPSKPRSIGMVARSLPPRRAPKWAVDVNWEPLAEQGHYNYIVSCPLLRVHLYYGVQLVP